MKKILLFPGCFDPFHIQHKAIIENLSKNPNYDELWILINKDSEQKKIISNFNDRLKMIELNIKETKKIKIVKEPIGFYTFEVVQNFKKKYQDFKFYLILGTDQANNILEWENTKNLHKLVKIIIIPRTTYPFNKKIKIKYEVELIKDLKINNFNSTSIKIGKSWDYLTKKSKEYILENHLYFENILKDNLTKKRFNHSLEVAKLSKKIAIFYGLSNLFNKSFIAGIFHDLTKEWNKEQHINFCKKLNINFDFLEKLPFSVWHGKTAMLFLKHELKINDDEILNSINFHTTAKANMSDLEQIVYIADKLEISKTGFTFNEIKKILKTKTLKKIFLQIFFEQSRKIKEKGCELTPDSQRAFDFYF